MLPRVIDPSPHDPLLLRPLPARAPADPSALVSELATQLHACIDGASSHGAGPDPVLLNTLSAGVRHATRSAQSTVNAGRVGCAAARSALDGADADLRAAMYELGRVRAAIAECDAYAPAYTALPLVPEAEFLAAADPAELAQLPDDAQERHYALTLLRLEAELAGVAAREQQVAALTRERDALVRARREVRAKYDAVDVWLADYAKTTNAMASKIRDVTRVTNPPRAAGAHPAQQPAAKRAKRAKNEAEADTAEEDTDAAKTGTGTEQREENTAQAEDEQGDAVGQKEQPDAGEDAEHAAAEAQDEGEDEGEDEGMIEAE